MTNLEQQELLADRHRREEDYHDQKNQAKVGVPGHYRFNPTYRVFRKMKEMLVLTPATKVLECGCGTGWITAEIGASGAVVHSFDISGEAVAKTSELLGKLNLHNCDVRKMAAEELEYPDDEFDYVIGFAILHHLDLQVSLPELLRVLKPGGAAVFAEPLGTNPAINLYRRLTPAYRTPDEKPLLLSSFASQIGSFDNFQHEEFFLTALIPIAVSYLPFMHRYIDGMMSFFMALDRKILGAVPALGRFAWYSIVTMSKPVPGRADRGR